MKISDIHKIYKRLKKTYKNTLFVMWGLYWKKDLIYVVLRDGSHEKLSPELTYSLSKLVENNIEYSQKLIRELEKLTNSELGALVQMVEHDLEFIKAMDIIQNKKFTSLELRDLSHLISNGVEFSKAMDIMERIIEMRQNEKIPYKNKDIIMHGLKDNGDLIDVFIWEDYKFLNVNNEIVNDLGANIGDSAIYFALNGAKKVIALEPYPYSFNFAVRNVKENNLEDKIEILSAGYGKDAEIFVDENVKNEIGTNLKSSGNGRKIKSYSLGSLIKKLNLDTAILKMDCEGCEYHILNENNSVLAKFPQMQIEFHNGSEKLVKKLRRAGFQVDYINREGSETFGYIYAKKPQATINLLKNG